MNFTKILSLLAMGLFLIGSSYNSYSQDATSIEIQKRREKEANNAPSHSQAGNPEGGKPEPSYVTGVFETSNKGTKICEKDDPKCKTTTKDPKLSAFSNEFSNEQAEFLLEGINSQKGFHLCCHSNVSFIPPDKENASFTINISGERVVYCYINDVESKSESAEDWRKP